MLHPLSQTRERAGSSAFGRTLFFYYLQTFAYDFIFGYALFPAYFQLQGVSPEVIGGILAFWAAGIIAFEIPAGLLADMIDRRLLLVLSPVSKAACFVIWIFAGGEIPLYFLGMAFWSLASALRSGTKEALLYEHVSAAEQTHRYTSILGRERALQAAATPAGAALGGLIAFHDPELAFWTSLGPLGLCALASCLVPDPRRRAAHAARLSLSRIPGLLRSTWTEFLSKREIRHLTLYVALCVTFLGTLEDFNQLFLLAINAPVGSLGVIVGAIGVIRVLLAYQAHWFERAPAFSWLAPMASGLALVVSGLLPPVFAGMAMAAAFIIIAPLLVLTMSRFQKALQGSARATTTSVMSAITEFLSVIFNLAIALLFSQLDVLKTYQAGGLYLIAFGVWELTHSRHLRRAAPPEARRPEPPATDRP